jgi:hypothetical protein
MDLIFVNIYIWYSLEQVNNSEDDILEEESCLKDELVQKIISVEVKYK